MVLHDISELKKKTTPIPQSQFGGLLHRQDKVVLKFVFAKMMFSRELGYLGPLLYVQQEIIERAFNHLVSLLDKW